MPTLTPMLWFDGTLKDAVDYYIRVFPNSSIISASPLPGAPADSEDLMTAEFDLDGKRFLGLNGRTPDFGFTDAISFMIDCANQNEVDYYWDALGDGGIELQCGWLRDKFGVSWQVVPSALGAFLSDPDPVRSQYAMQAMLKMKKIIIADLSQ